MQASGGVCGSPLLFPHRRSGWPCRQDTDHADRTRRQPWPAAATVPDPCPPRATPAAMSAMAAGITHVHAGGRRAGGGRTSVRGLRSQTPAWPSTPPWPRVPYISRPHSGRSGSSGRSSGSLQLSLLFLQGRPCGRPPAALRPGNHTTVTGVPASPSTQDRTDRRGSTADSYSGPGDQDHVWKRTGAADTYPSEKRAFVIGPV
jgi:hypothetical protein